MDDCHNNNELTVWSQISIKIVLKYNWLSLKTDIILPKKSSSMVDSIYKLKEKKKHANKNWDNIVNIWLFEAHFHFPTKDKSCWKNDQLSVWRRGKHV